MRPLPRKNAKPVDAAKIVDIPSAMDQPARPKPKRMRALLLGASALVICGLAAGAYITYGLGNAGSVTAERVTTGVADYTRLSEAVPVNATVVPENTVFLDTVEGGRVVALHVEDGAVVAEGAPLLTLKNTDLELQVIGREAQYTQQLSNLAQSQIAFDQSQLRYDRDLMDAKLEIDLTRASLARRLPVEQTGVPQSEIDRLQAELTHREATYEMIDRAKQRDTANASQNLDQLKASTNRMQDSVDILRQSLEQLTLKAPIDGQVSAFTLQPGQVLAPGARVGQVDKLDAYKVRAFVNEFYLGRLNLGETATASIGGASYELSVEKIYPTIENRQFEVDLVFEGAYPEGLRRGQNLQVRLILGNASETLTIPNGPFVSDTGGQWVFVVSADGATASRREIELGRRSPDRVEVLSGLTANEVVLISSYDSYGDYEDIKISNK